jgi:hypothetical protein
VAAKKKSPDAQKVEKFLDDLRQNVHDHTPLGATAPTFWTFVSSIGALMTQAVIFGVAGGIGLRIVRFIAGF